MFLGQDKSRIIGVVRTYDDNDDIYIYIYTFRQDLYYISFLLLARSSAVFLSLSFECINI